MTAINFYLDADAVHVFSDTALYTGHEFRIVGFGSKVRHLPAFNAVLTFSGRMVGLERLARAIELSGAADLLDLLDRMPDLVKDVVATLDDGDFQATIAGVVGGLAIGRIVDSDEGSIWLRPGAYARRPGPTTGTFDPDDIEASGLRLLIEQRGLHCAVAGHAQYTRLDANGFHSRILQDWASGQELHAIADEAAVGAKIKDLEVDYIKIAHGTLWKSARDTDPTRNVTTSWQTICTVTATNDAEFSPILIVAQNGLIVPSSGGGGFLDTQIRHELRLIRLSDSTVLEQRQEILWVPKAHSYRIDFTSVDINREKGSWTYALQVRRASGSVSTHTAVSRLYANWSRR